MDPVVASVVSALSAGALAIGKGFADEAVKDGYKALKRFVVSRFAKAEPVVEMVEQEPESADEQRVLAKQIGAAAGDAELKALAATLLAALEARESEPQARAMFDFGKLRAAKNFELSDIVLSGALLRADEANFEGDFKATNIRPAQAPGEDKKKQ